MRWAPFHERFFSRIEVAPNGCHVWAGDHYEYGYGRIGVGKKQYQAHRIAWAMANGCIPEGKLVLHRCDNPPCVNPAHLFLGTDADNARDKMEKGRCWHPKSCPKGHPYDDPSNVYVSPRGARNCRQCSRDFSREYMRQKRAAAKNASETSQ